MVCLCLCLSVANILEVHALTFDTIYVGRIDTHGAAIVWRTDESSNGQIEYGIGMNDATRVSLILDMTKDHQTPMFGLLEGEDYVFRIKARSAAGAQIISGWQTFRTLGIPAPKIREVKVMELTPEGGTLVWRSNAPTRGTFECGYDTSYGFQASDERFAPDHEVNVTRFNPRKKIHYRVQAADPRGREAPVYEGTFVTAEKNLAVGAKTTGTFTRNAEPGYVQDTPPIIERVTDGQMEYYRGMAASGDPASADQWIEVDLGQIVTAADIVTVWWQLAYPQKFAVKISLDRETWRDMGDTYDASMGNPAQSYSGDPLFEHFIHMRSALLRYVRVEIPRGAPYYRRFSKFNFVSCFELKIYPPDEIR